jgi:hypothetical protein
MTSAAADPVVHAPPAGQDKPTGARNENSVLFSLAALTGGGGAVGGGAKPSAVNADKGPPPSSKADLRALMGAAPALPPQKSKLDDIINLSGGGVYSPAMLTAPILAPPPAELPVTGDLMSAPAKPKSKMTWIFGGVVVLIAIGAYVFSMNSKAESEAAMAAASASAKAAAEALQAALAAAEQAKASPDPTPAPAETASAAPTALAPGQAAPKPEGEKKTVIAKVDKGEKAPVPAPPPGPQLEKVPPPTPAPKEQAPAPAPAGGSGDFDRAAALSALSAAATAAQSCKKSDGPTGSGRIAVTFANNGQATTANVEGPPFAGTPVGGCVAARFRGTHVPPFGGAPVTVHKTFNIN